MEYSVQHLKDMEKVLAADAADKFLSPQDSQAWHDCGYTFRCYNHFNKILVIWRCFAGEPEVMDTVTVSSVECDTYDGLGVKVLNNSKESLWLAHYPKKLWDYPVYAHVPFISQLQYVPGTKGCNPTLRFPLVFKSEHNPRNHLIDGVVYITQLSEFKSSYPKYKDIRL